MAHQHTDPEALAARLDVLGTALQAIARAMPRDQAASAAGTLRALVADALASRRSMSTAADAATARELAPLLDALGPSGNRHHQA